MASVFKKPGSPFWYAAFRDHLDMRVQRTTKQRQHAKAVQVANQLERAASKGRHRTLTEAQARRIIAEIVEDTMGEPMHFHTCREFLDEWRAEKRGAVGEKSIEKYEQVLTAFLDHLGERAELPLAAIGPRDVREFRDALNTKRRTAGTVNQMVRKVLTAPFNKALKHGYITVNPCAAVEALKDDSEAQRDTFTTAEVATLITTAEGDWRGAILAGYYTGLRLRDITNLTWDAVDFEKGFLRVKPKKSGPTLTLPLHPELSDWLREQTRGIGKAPIFPKLSGRGTGGARGLSAGFATIMAKAGIRGRVLGGGGGKGRKTLSLSFHSLRHSFISALANAGVSPELRKRLSGHSDDRSHARYTHHELENLRTAVSSLPAVSR